MRKIDSSLQEGYSKAQDQMLYDEWIQAMSRMKEDQILNPWELRALEELRKRDRALELAKESIWCTCVSSSPCSGCQALQQIEEVLK